LFVVIAAFIAPSLGQPKFGGIFTFIQEFQGFISPGVIAIFLFGLLVPKAPRFLGWSGIILNACLYGLFKWWLGDVIVEAGLWFSDEISFLDRMAICFFIVCIYCTVMTLIKPLPAPVELPVNKDMDMTPSPMVKMLGYGVIGLTIILYIVFW
jgi:SSS family solute:Na+ symporter